MTFVLDAVIVLCLLALGGVLVDAVVGEWREEDGWKDDEPPRPQSRLYLFCGHCWAVHPYPPAGAALKEMPCGHGVAYGVPMSQDMLEDCGWKPTPENRGSAARG